MNILQIEAFLITAILAITAPVAAQDKMQGMDMPMKGMEKMPAKSALQPAEGASIEIISPKAEQVFKGDRVPLQFKLTKGKRGQHGELMGMFTGRQGTLNGIKPGPHVLELRVVTADHQTELDARDRIEFVVK